MTSIKRAIKYLLNKKSKSAILILLFTVLITTVLTGFIIDDTINSYYNKIDNKNGIEVNVMSSQSPYDKNGKYVGLTKDEFEEILKKDYVTDYRLDYMGQTKDQSIKLLDLNKMAPADAGMVMASSMGGSTGMSISGTTNLTLHPSFKSGELVLKNNKTDLANNEVIISEELAKENNLEIGSTFTLTDYNGKVITVTVVDTFTTTGQYGYLQNNTIYSNADTAKQFNITDPENALGFLTIYINDIKNYEQLKKDIYALEGHSEEDIMLTLSDELYTNVISPLETTQHIVKIATIIIGLITILILAIILTLMIKERYYEIGVLYSLGASKTSIISQFIFESIILVTIAFIISTLLAVTLGSYVIELVAASSQFQSLNGSVMVMSYGTTTPDQKMTIETVISMTSLLKGYVLNVFVITLINLVVLSKVLLKKPREILIKE